jgi:hypothetical protein
MIDYLIEQVQILLADLETHRKFLACMVDGLHELLAAIEQDHASATRPGKGNFETDEVEF